MINWIHTSASDSDSTLKRVVSVGSFDGVHRGHRSIIEKMVSLASGKGLGVLVASFDPHPRAVLRGEQEQRLTSIEERAELLRAAGVTDFVTLAFDQALASMSPHAFVEDVLVDELGASHIVVGHDHRFGKDRAGDVELLRQLAPVHGFEVVQLDALNASASPVSSSRIRNGLFAGSVKEAADLLGRLYSLSGVVIKGAGRGHTIGIPTANLDPADATKIIPAKGVYAVKVWIPQSSEWLPGMMNIGNRPTFEGEGLHLEVNVIDWTGDLYGDEVRVEFVQRIRNEVKFDGIEALIRQLNEDRQRCTALLQEIT